MPNLPVGFLHGNSANLPQEIQSGSFLFTDDTDKLYLDIGGKRHDLNYQSVKHMNGISDSLYINIAGLSYGHYIIDGYYRYDNTDELKNTSVPMDVIIMADENTGDRVAVFSAVESGEHITHVITYRNNKIYTHEKQGSKQIWGEF